MKEETDMTKQEKDNRVPLWERMNLTLEEAPLTLVSERINFVSCRIVSRVTLFYGSVQKGF